MSSNTERSNFEILRPSMMMLLSCSVLIACCSVCSVNGEALAQREDFATHALFGLRIAVGMLAQRIEDFENQAADIAELVHAEAACRTCGRAEANTRCDGRLLGIERNAVL